MADLPEDLCRRLAEETRERIRADRGRASVRVAQLLAVIEERLLDPELDVQEMLRAAGQRDPNVSTRFSAEVGLPPKAYLLEERMKLGGRMLVASNFKVWEIGFEVGYATAGSFTRAFKKWSGMTPSAFRKAAAAPDDGAPEDGTPDFGPPPAAEESPVPDELVSRRDVRRAIEGKLPAEEAEALAEELFSLGDMVCTGYRELSRPEGGGVTVESTMARSLLRWIAVLPYEVQMKAVESQAPRYRSVALFNRLCWAAVKAEDGLAAMKMASLALAALQGLGDRVGDVAGGFVSIFARAHGVLGHAKHRAGDLEQAKQELDRAMMLLARAREAQQRPHPVVVAEVCLYRAALEAELGHVEVAEKLSREGQTLLEMLADELLGPEEEGDRENPGRP